MRAPSAAHTPVSDLRKPDELVNLAHAKDAAVCLAFADLNHAASPAGPVYVRSNQEDVG
jgi:hypothetical protein